MHVSTCTFGLAFCTLYTLREYTVCNCDWYSISGGKEVIAWQWHTLTHPPFPLRQPNEQLYHPHPNNNNNNNNNNNREMYWHTVVVKKSPFCTLNGFYC